MRRLRAFAVTAAMLIAASPAGAAPAVLEVLGVVTNSARPVGDALVIAMNLQDLATVQTWSSRDGSFTLPTLRSGIYKVIAVKHGFAPAITTIVPTRPTHRLNLKLESERAGRKAASQEIWELRASLPGDVLRQVEAMLGPDPGLAADAAPRFRGEMMSMAGLANTPSDPAFARTEVGVEGRIGTGWKVGLRGDMQRFERRVEELSVDGPVAESSGMSMEFRSVESSQRYRVASTRSSWMYASPMTSGQQVDVAAHNFEWQRGPASVQVRYFQQDNLFSDLSPESNLIEVAGSVPLYQTGRAGVGVGLRVMQQTVESAQDPFRRADLSADGSLALVPSMVLQYGMSSRIGQGGQEWAPRAGAEWKLAERTSLVGSAQVKVVDREPGALAVPSIVFWSEDASLLPRYAYTFGFVSESEQGTTFSAVASVMAVDQAVRVVFADPETQFWDGLLLDSGDVRRDLRVSYRQQFAGGFAVDVAASAGTASQSDPAPGSRAKMFVAGDVQSTFRPTGTTLAVSYRDIQQPLESAADEYRAERLRVRLAQSLYLPLDVRLLLGLELARAENSPYLVDSYVEEGRSKKYIGGLAVNF